MEQAYGRETYFNNQVNTASQKKLIVMLYSGAIKNIKLGIKAIKDKNIAKTNTHFIKSQNIISELMTTLDFDAGGDIAQNLYQLYDYMYQKLIRANIDKDIDKAEEVEKYLLELKEVWEQI